MPAAATYDLMLLLSTTAPEEQRSKVLTNVESAISSGGGSIERNDDWGQRPMAYQIRHQPDAEYHLLQFSAPGEVVGELAHTLRITDAVLRSRIIKVRPGTPPAPSSPPPVVAPAGATAGSSPASAPTATAPAAAPAESEAPTDDGAPSGEPAAAAPSEEGGEADQ